MREQLPLPTSSNAVSLSINIKNRWNGREGKQEINKKKENQGVEAYGKIFQGVLLLIHKRESRDMMLNDTISETEIWKETKRNQRRGRIKNNVN